LIFLFVHPYPSDIGIVIDQGELKTKLFSINNDMQDIEIKEAKKQ
jgi:hypothetical protein